MSDHSEPDWSLLPGNPVAFFGLSAGFDLRALKSVYGALVRRYKPEKAPEEFQRIRAAFEALKHRCGSGEGRSLLPPSFDWSVPLSTDMPLDDIGPIEGGPRVAENGYPHANRWSGENDDRNGRPPEIDLPDRLAPSREGPNRDAERPPQSFSTREIYDAQRATEHKTPRDYYSLAILSDLIEDDYVGFAGWLLAGLERFPGEPGLCELLHGYYGTEKAARHAEFLLIATSQSVPDDRYYDLTRPLWERLICAVDFATFRKLLDICEANLDGDHREGYVGFHWWVLKHAVWDSDPEWFEAKLADLESRNDLARWYVQRERDLVDHLLVYRLKRDWIVTKGVVRTEMDRAVIACTTSRDDVADRRLVEAQQSLVAHKDDLLREFPMGCVGTEPLLILWEHLSEDAATRLGIPPLEVNDDSTLHVRRLAASLMDSGCRLGFQFLVYGEYSLLWFGKAVIFLMAAALAIIGVAGVIGGMVQGQILATFGAAVAVMIFFFAFWGLWRAFSKEQKTLLSNFCPHYYRWIWRRQILDFLDRTPMPIPYVVHQLLSLDNQRIHGWRIRGADKIAEYLAKDVGLRLLQVARRFCPKRPKR